MSGTFDIVFKDATVVSPSGREVVDVGVRNGKIERVGDLRSESARETINCHDYTMLPGGIDTQVHFREPGLEHKETIESGTISAALGGITTIFEMPNTQPPTTNEKALREKLEIAERDATVNYGFFIGAARDNAEQLGELEKLPGVPGVKIFMGSSTGSLLVDKDHLVRQVLEHGNSVCPVHSEDEDRLRMLKEQLPAESVHDHPRLRDAEAAIHSTTRLLRLCRETGRRIHVLHISTAGELPLLAEAKREGLPVTCEVTPQHLAFSAEDYDHLDTRLQMNPPVRSDEHRTALWKALEEDLFDVFGSDHAPHTLEEKAKPYPGSPSGMPGVQTMLPCLLSFVATKRITLEKIVRMLCERPAELYGVKGKGKIAESYDADLVLLKPDRSFEVERSWLATKSGWSPFEGMSLFGRPEHVYVHGVPVVTGGELTGKRPARAAEFDWK